jgi:signal transduction histidine kinase
MLDIIMINQVDSLLNYSADQALDALWVTPDGAIGYEAEEFDAYNLIEFQVWSNEGVLLASSEPKSPLNEVWDPDVVEGDRPDFRNASVNNVSYRLLSLPLEANDELYGWLQVSMPLTEMQETQDVLQLVISLVIIFAIFASGFIGWFVVGKGLEPLTNMADIAQNITSTDDLSLRLPVESGRVDEIRQLGLTFNKTLARLERIFKIQRQFLADVSHELRTPLTVIKGNIGLMRLMREFDQEALDSVESEVDRLTRLVGDLLIVTQAETGRLPLVMEPVEIDDLLFEVFEQMKVLSAGKHEIRILNIEPSIVAGDRDRLKQVFLNLGVNAIKYTPAGKRIWLDLAVSGDWVQVKFSDEGRGIPKAEVGRLFDRFYRGDKSRKRDDKNGGFGLGLPIAYWIVRSHGGRIDVETEVDKGTTFTVWLPNSQAEIPTRPLKNDDDE